MNEPVEQQPGGVSQSPLPPSSIYNAEAAPVQTIGSSSFSWVVVNGDSPVVLNLRGELDLAASLATKETLLEDLERCQGPVVVDATDLEFIDSTGLRLLLDIKRLFDRDERTFTLGAVSPAVQRVLDVSGVGPVFEGNGRSNGARY